MVRPHLSHAFSEQVARTPHALAMVSGSRRITYRKLAEQSNQVSHFLRRQGVGPGTIVALRLPRSPDLVISLLAILKSGAAFVILEPSYPRERVLSLLTQCRPSLIIDCEPAMTKEVQVAVLTGDHVKSESRAEPISDPKVEIQADEIATVLFTSGSTGTAKAIPKMHRDLRANAAMYSLFQLSPADRHEFKASLDSTLMMREVFWPLVTGGTMCILPHALTQDVAALAGFLRDNRITFVTLVPSLLRLMLERPEFSKCASLRHICSFGERLDADLIARCRTANSAELSSFYGTTEVPSLCLWRADKQGRDPQGNLGFPLEGRRVYVMGETKETLAPADTGELCAETAEVIRYLDESPNAENKFVANPFQPSKASWLYRTGDLVRQCPDGSLEFVGRIDDQVKVRGYRVEPQQVEAVLCQYPDIAECAVVARPDQYNEDHLVAFVVSERRMPEVKSMRRHMERMLPKHHIPSAFIQLDRLPRLPNGKLDRSSLSQDISARKVPTNDSRMPSGSIERRLAEIWLEILGLSEVGADDSFFDLGGTSVLAVRLFSRIEQEFGCNLPLSELVRNDTISQLAKRLVGAERGTTLAKAITLRTGCSDRKVIMMPSFTGDLLSLRDLIARLDELTVVGVQLALDDTHAEALRDMRTIARYAVEAIRTEQPDGPYALVGFSFGGLLAYEVAGLLQDMNEQVEFLGVIDIGPGRHWRKATIGHRVERILRIAGNFPNWVVDEVRFFSVVEFRNRLLRKGRWFARRFKSRGRAELRLEDAFDLKGAFARDAVKSVFQALRDYQPTGRLSKLTLFRARTRPLLSGSPNDLGWGNYVDRVDVRRIHGNHETILRPPDVVGVAEEMQEALRSLSRVPESLAVPGGPLAESDA